MRGHRPLMSVAAAAFGALVGLVGCAAPTDGPQPYLPGAKADDASDYGITRCQRDQLLDFVNRCETGDAELAARGLWTSQRTNLLAKRGDSCGLDGDRVFDNLHDVRGVSSIGPATIRNLGQTFDDDCATNNTGGQSARAFFSPELDKKKSHLGELVRVIGTARHHIDLALYSFSDTGVMDALKKAQQEHGVKVRIIYNKARNNPTNAESISMEVRGLDVRYVASSKTMHHKFMVIDGPVQALGPEATATLVTGSGNWTSSAQHTYDENMVVLQGFPSLVLAFQHEFNTIWDRSEDFVHGDPKPYAPSPLPLDPSTFPVNPSARAAFTMGNFNPDTPGFRRIWGNYVVADEIVKELERATDYVYIASGHLRSKPIYEALVALKKARPQVEIRVYLDGQEYVRDNVDNRAKRSKCLDRPTTDTAQEIEECYLGGWHYAYDVATVQTDGEACDDSDQSLCGKIPGDIELRLKYYAYRWKYSYAQMHHKYLVIDGKTLITGSYNLSHNAEVGSFENVVILRSEIPAVQGLIADFEDNFYGMWNTDADGAIYDALVATIQDESQDSVPLVFRERDTTLDRWFYTSMALPLFTPQPPAGVDLADLPAKQRQSVKSLKSEIYWLYKNANADGLLRSCTNADRATCARP